jgi:hypothetical protein
MHALVRVLFLLLLVVASTIDQYVVNVDVDVDIVVVEAIGRDDDKTVLVRICVVN